MFGRKALEDRQAEALARLDQPMMFNEFIRVRREAKGWNQRDLAIRLGVKQQTVSRWESGIAVPRPDRCLQLADALGVPRPEVLRLAGYLDPAAAGAPDPAVLDSLVDLHGVLECFGCGLPVMGSGTAPFRDLLEALVEHRGGCAALRAAS